MSPPARLRALWAAIMARFSGLNLPPPDTTKPAVALAVSASRVEAEGIVTLTLSADDAGGIKTVRLSRNGVLIASPLSSGTLVDGINRQDTPNATYTYLLVVTDQAGNTEQATATVVVDIPPPDITPPTVSLNAPATVTAQGRVTLAAAPADDVAVARVTFERLSPDPAVLGERSGAPWIWEEAVDLGSFDNGTRRYRVTAVDTSGNASPPAEQDVTVNIPAAVDSTPPTVSLSAEVRDRSVILKAAASDASGVKFVKFYRQALDGTLTLIRQENSAPYEAFQGVSEADNGSVTYVAIATDKSPAANTAQDSKTVTIALSAPPAPTGGLSNDGDAFTWAYAPYTGSGTISSYRTYSLRQSGSAPRVLIAETPTAQPVLDNTVQDGAVAWYKTYMVVGDQEMLVDSAFATQPARTGWTSQQLVISQPGTYTLRVRNTDSTRPAVVVNAGVTGVTLNGLLASAGGGISVGVNAGVTLNGLRAWGLHPGVAGKGHGYLFDGYKARTMIMENCYTENWRFSVYALGAGSTNLQTLRIRRNVMRNCEGRKATADGEYVTSGDYRAAPVGHFIQLNQCKDIGDAEISWNLMIQEPDIGFVEDLVNIYASSCLAGKWGRVHNNLAYGGNSGANIATDPYAGCGFITDGVSSTTRYWTFSQNVCAGVANAGIGVAHGWDIDVLDNDAFGAGVLEDLSTIWGINVGFYGYDYKAADPIQRIRIKGNRSRYYRPAGTSQNADGTKSTNGNYYLTKHGVNGCEMAYSDNFALPLPPTAQGRIEAERALYRSFLGRVKTAGITVGVAA